MRERFRDGAAILATYEFEINHFTEDDNDRRRNVTRTAPTSGVGFVRQQGDDSPEVFKYQGRILTQTQYNAMLGYYNACRNRTVFFRDYQGAEHEVLITSFATTQISVIKNERDPSLMHYWRYRLEMELIA